MTPVSAFFPWVLPHAYGVTDNLAGQAIVDACIELCDEAGVVQSVFVVDAVANRPDYDIETPSQQELSEIKAVFYGAQPLNPVGVDEVRHGAAVRAGEDSVVAAVKRTPEVFYQRIPGDASFFLWPVPDVSRARWVSVRASFRPTRTATQVDDKLFNDYVQQIAYGALSRLLLIPGQPFTNPVLAEAMEKKFSATVSSAGASSRRGSVRSAMRVQPRNFP